MCNEAARRIALHQLRQDWSQLKIPLRFPEGLPNLAPLDSIRITDPTLILRADPDGAGAEGVIRRWSWPGPTGKPVYNFRSEGRRLTNFADGGRCLIPIDAFFEFSEPPPGAKRKSKWRFTAAPGALGFDWFCVAGLWRRDATVGEAFTMLTCEPGPDIAPYHRRQIVLPPRDAWAGWLDGSLSATDICRPTPAGSLHVEQLR
ncbi:SOS response-associated peptidase family protein [Sphingomonas sp.]|uniref:SOS response-associated peptidase family protein n=1 Tax=Sphingomonas sp. TaxID=28214 RepID=UPI003CC51A94